MVLDFYQHLPQHIDPVAFSIGSFAVRWYAISYAAGFLVTYLVLSWRLKNGEFDETVQVADKKNEFANSALIVDFLLVAFFATLVGGRLGFVLFYDFSSFISNPLSIISPFVGGKLVGIYGMSYHGALIGVLIGSYFFTKFKKINFLGWADFVIPAAPLGYFFGRIGNFLNGELYGRATESSLGMYFLTDQVILRHPSQLYEAFLEGLVLFFVLWRIRKIKLVKGSFLFLYLIGYGTLRILAEMFREPDPQIGFVLSQFTLGQILSFTMIAGGVACYLIFYRYKLIGKR
ncbi:MAG: hypothetical protein ACD_56C00069G0003 [uncultured bacterium]|nr:MAG: hypothetical protein ACD_56C00069G0003 [uncultured bacterium]